jgi:hypothetical protein
MDHFQGSLTLSRLEIVNLAMKCLHARKTDSYLQGDMAYALMGLLRRRPMVDRTDSEFQALARLSLANDSDCLLERLTCVLPKTMDKDWIRADDAWDVNLWDSKYFVSRLLFRTADSSDSLPQLSGSRRWRQRYSYP